MGFHHSTTNLFRHHLLIKHGLLPFAYSPSYHQSLSIKKLRTDCGLLLIVICQLLTLDCEFLFVFVRF